MSKREKVKKVFIGWTDTASQVGVYQKGFAAAGVETLTAIDIQHSSNVTGDSDYNLDVLIPQITCLKDNEIVEPLVRQAFKKQLKEYIRQRAVLECDTFFFIWNSFAGDHSDYKELKRLGKRIVTNFVGHDIRWGPAMEQEFHRYGFQPIEYAGDPSQWMKLSGQLHYLRTAERYSDMIISLANQAQLQLRPYYNFYYPLDLTVINEHHHQRKTRPVVLHSPTNPEIKGTRYVLETFKRLEQEGISFEGKLLRGVPHRQILKHYEASDILVCQLLCPGGGKQAYELLAAGKIVLSRMGYDAYPQVNTAVNPIIDVGPDTLYERLKEIILDYPRRQALAKLGRPYVEKYHDVVKLCQTIIQRLENPGPESSESPERYETGDILVPRFFRDSFEPERKNIAWFYNKYNHYVQDCSWYRRHIQSGKRGDLQF